jgi:hypothetical protein
MIISAYWRDFTIPHRTFLFVIENQQYRPLLHDKLFTHSILFLLVVG